MILTDYHEGILRFKLPLFIFSCILLIIGLISLLRGIDILEMNLGLEKED